VTINDIVLNEGTEHESRRPFEVFINSKNMDHFQWIVALTRIMSAVFRKGGDVTFLVEEMKAVFDPRGGYFKAGGVYMPSIVAEIGFRGRRPPEEHRHDRRRRAQPSKQREAIAEKRAQYDGQRRRTVPAQRDHVQQVQHQGHHHHGRLRHLPQLRLLQMRLIA
jgi:hypothetical protein